MMIAFEGPDGCGKSSHAARVKERLNAKFFKFPNKDTPTGKLIYENLESKWQSMYLLQSTSDVVECIKGDFKEAEMKHLNALVFQALQSLNRLEVANELVKAEMLGNVVLDRYWPSGYAYGKADGLDGDYLINAHTILPAPDLFILLDIDISDSIERRPERRDRYEANHAFMQKVMENYRELWAKKLFPSKWEIINARGTPEETAKLIEDCIVRHKELM